MVILRPICWQNLNKQKFEKYTEQISVDLRDFTGYKLLGPHIKPVMSYGREKKFQERTGMHELHQQNKSQNL